MGRMLGCYTGACFQRCAGMDALNALPDDLRVLVQESVKHTSHTWGTYWRTKEEVALRRCVARGDYKAVQWSDAEARQAREIASGLWDAFATKNARCKLLVDQLKAQLADIGKL